MPPPSLLADLEGYYGRFGFPALPELSVTFGNIELHGAAMRFVKDRDMRFLWAPPSITWPEEPGEKMVVFMDLDAGGRQAIDGITPGPIGPFVHAMWTHCTGSSISSCKALIPYWPPGVSSGTNRYVFLLMRQPLGKQLQSAPTASERAHWDFGRFLEANFPVLKSDTLRPGCSDDATWDNFSGKRCGDYAAEWCSGGRFNIGAEWTSGAQFNHPERHCCACGKPAGGGSVAPSIAGLRYNFMYVSGTVDEANADPRTPL